jgi:molecular chaperone DnaK
LSYGLDKKDNETILVFDLGGGTFDVSILEVGDGVFEVLATSGDTQLGGDDFDEKIVQWLIKEFKEQEDIDLTKDSQALQRLTEAAEKAKIELSNLTQSSINLPFISITPEGPKHLEKDLTRAKFEELCADLIERCKTPIEMSLKDAELTPTSIDQNVLVGGSTRIPAVQKLVESLLGKVPNQTVNPDEVVAVGAAVQAGVLGGEVKDILLLDVTPLSLGVETLGGITTKITPRNTIIPTKKSETFSTAVDNQPNVEIHVLQGERELAKDNKSLGTFRLDGIAPAARGVPQIEVTFDIDANGILSVTAKDKATDKQQSITISGASTLPKDEVERMVKDAEANAAADKEKSENIAIKNEAETICYQTRKQLEQLESTITSEEKQNIENLILELEEVTKKEDYTIIKEKTEAVKKAIMEVGEKAYKNAGANASPEKDVIETDFSSEK